MAYGDAIRKRLEELLAEQGITRCEGWNIARGWWMSLQADVMRWQVWAVFKGSKVHVGSWQSITDCVRYGFTIAPGTESGGYVDIDVTPKYPEKKI